MLGLAKLTFVERFLELFHHPILLVYLILYGAMFYVLFYIVFEFILRLLFHKVIKKSVYDYLKGKNSSSKFELHRELVEFRRDLTKGMNLPFELGYFDRDEIGEINSSDLFITQNDKEKSIIIITNMFNVWTCILVHAVIASLLILQVNWIMVLIFSLVSIPLFYNIYLMIPFVVENIEALPVVQKSITKQK